MTIDTLMRSLVAELAAGDVPAPLAQDFTLVALWDDLARLAGEPTPPEVAALLDGRGITLVRAGRAAVAGPTPPPGGPRHDDE